MVVVITSAGGVTKLRYVFADPVDPGLTMWAAEYLNERLGGSRIGSRARGGSDLIQRPCRGSQ